MSFADIYQQVTKQITDQIAQGVIPWHKAWKGIASGHMPQNLVSSKAYSGINVFILLTTPSSSPYWLTYKQAADQGGHVRKGEHGAVIVYWDFVPDREDPERRIPFLKKHTVFNVEQCEGITAPAAPAEPAPGFNPIDKAEQILAAVPNPPKLYHDGGDRAFYSPSLDEIHLPQREMFDTPSDYYDTAFHEFAHATGHPSRLSRPELGKKDEPYSREELVAELTAALVGGVAGLDPVIRKNNAAYISEWLTTLKHDPKAFVTAAGKAQKAANYLLNVQTSSEEL